MGSVRFVQKVGGRVVKPSTIGWPNCESHHGRPTDSAAAYCSLCPHHQHPSFVQPSVPMEVPQKITPPQVTLDGQSLMLKLGQVQLVTCTAKLPHPPTPRYFQLIKAHCDTTLINKPAAVRLLNGSLAAQPCAALGLSEALDVTFSSRMVVGTGVVAQANHRSSR